MIIPLPLPFDFTHLNKINSNSINSGCSIVVHTRQEWQPNNTFGRRDRKRNTRDAPASKRN
jgi:hypothetical protein